MQRNFHKIRVTNAKQANQFTKSGGRKKESASSKPNKKSDKQPCCEPDEKLVRPCCQVNSCCKPVEKPICSCCHVREKVVVTGPECGRISGQFDAKKPEAELDFTVCVTENYHGQPLVSGRFVRTIQARCWRPTPRVVCRSELPGGKTVETSDLIVAKIEVDKKYYRVQFGILPLDSTVFSDCGWSTIEGKPDAVIPTSFLCEKNRVPRDFCQVRGCRPK